MMYFVLTGTLFIDPQSLNPGAFCPYCGGERYFPSLLCLRCEGGIL